MPLVTHNAGRIDGRRCLRGLADPRVFFGRSRHRDRGDDGPERVAPCLAWRHEPTYRPSHGSRVHQQRGPTLAEAARRPCPRRSHGRKANETRRSRRFLPSRALPSRRFCVRNAVPSERQRRNLSRRSWGRRSLRSRHGRCEPPVHCLWLPCILDGRGRRTRRGGKCVFRRSLDRMWAWLEPPVRLRISAWSRRRANSLLHRFCGSGRPTIGLNHSRHS